MLGMEHAQAALRLQRVAAGLTRPVAVTHAGDGSGRLFIVLQDGTIRIRNSAGLREQPFLDIRSLVSCCGERGLLSAAFHPQYRTNGFFYVNYTNKAGNTVIARYTVSTDPNVANPASRKVILTVAQPFPNHNGGQIQFGPNGYLYIGMGDGGSSGDPENRAQNLRTLMGKILRIDVNRTSANRAYGIPPTNPFVGRANVRPEIWASGLRNPWRFSFDRATGDLYLGDVGQGNWEEVNFQNARSRGGENYGWRRMEGRHCHNPTTGCQTGTLKLPIIEYSHAAGCAVTGGYRYRGARTSSLVGRYLYGDYCSGRIWAATFNSGSGWRVAALHNSGFQISAFGEDQAGEVYVVDYNGAVYRIVGITP
jgi:glucose/arabinose dehydrogenase